MVEPVFSHTAGDYTLNVYYEGEHHRFKLGMWRGGVCRMIQYVPATYKPVFGIDVVDMAEITRKAEDMCVHLEGEA